MFCEKPDMKNRSELNTILKKTVFSDGDADAVKMKLNDRTHAESEMNMKDIEDDVLSVRSCDELVFQNDFFSNEDTKQNSVDAENLSRECSIEMDGVTESRSEGIRIERQCSSTYENIKSFIQEEKLMHAIQNSGTTHGLCNYINSSIERWECKRINVAVTGNSGTGKSSLINALRGLKANSPGAAAVGIRETTTEARKYKFPENDKVALWDLPGIGTQQFTRESYLDDFELSKFDIVVVVTANRFLENDVWIAEQALVLGRSVIFVRTKIDFDVMNARRDDPDDFDEARCIATIKKDIEENIEKRGIAQLSEGIFLVSSPDRQKFDFTILSEKLKSLMNTKGVGICKLLLHHLEKAIQEKRDAVKCKFTGKKVASAVIGFLPIPKLETALGILTLRQIREVCLRIFCQDDESLQKVSMEVNIPVQILKTYHLKSFNTEQLNDVERLYNETEECRFSKFRKYSKYFLPFVGSAMSAFKGPKVLQECVDIICNIMSDAEFHLVQLRLQRLERQLRPL